MGAIDQNVAQELKANKNTKSKKPVSKAKNKKK